MPGKFEKVDFTKDPGVIRRQLELGWEIAGLAARLAPKETGGGAKSIRAEVIRAEDGDEEVRVSWDRDHFYMYFAEVGTQHQSARPFLRPAGYQVMGR